MTSPRNIHRLTALVSRSSKAGFLLTVAIERVGPWPGQIYWGDPVAVETITLSLICYWLRENFIFLVFHFIGIFFFQHSDLRKEYWKPFPIFKLFLHLSVLAWIILSFVCGFKLIINVWPCSNKKDSVHHQSPDLPSLSKFSSYWTFDPL